MTARDHSKNVDGTSMLRTKIFIARLRVAEAREFAQELERRTLQSSRIAKLLLEDDVQGAVTANAEKHLPGSSTPGH